MLPTNAQDLAAIVEGELIAGPASTVIQGVTVDSQKTNPGDVFVAFEGQKTDGHRFAADAIARGSTTVVVTKPIHAPADVTVIRVPSALAAVQRLAKRERAQFHGPVIGVTGSNGKTTTKEMLALAFGGADSCLYTAGNMNTELGLPLTLLRRTNRHEAIVLEMGMRGRGQIAELCNIAQPNAGIITNIGQSHMELLGSQENIALAKAELLEALPSDGYAALPAADPWLQHVADRSRARILWYGIEGEQNDVGEDWFARASALRQTAEGISFMAQIQDQSCLVHLSTFGRHNVQNALGALALGVAHGRNVTEMAQALTAFQGTEGRLRVLPGPRGMTIVDDCYNASPLSMKASLDVLASLAAGKPAVAILGDMYELGEFSEQGHREVGEYVAARRIDTLLTVGTMTRVTAAAAQAACTVHHADTVGKAIEMLPDTLPDNAVVLVKASRGMGLERVVAALQNE